jgi:hypothetical protein
MSIWTGIELLMRNSVLRRTALLAITAALGGLVAGCSSDEQDEATSQVTAGSLKDYASALQRVTVYEHDPLDELGTLQTVSEQSQVVGVGKVTGVQSAYAVSHGKLADGSPDLDEHMLLVIEPQELAQGSELLGPSGLVYVDHYASPAQPISEIREDAVGTEDRVAFFLTEVDYPSEVELVDEFQGRTTDDPLLTPTHVSALLGINEADREAFPLLTNELLEGSDENLEALNELGADVDGFTTASGKPDPESGEISE